MKTREETIAEGLRIASGFKGPERTFPGFYGNRELYKMHAALMEISKIIDAVRNG